MRRLLGWMLGLSVGWLALLLLARGIGSTRLPRPVTDLFTRDLHLTADGWCWRGICPGLTAIREVEPLLNAYADGTVQNSSAMSARPLRWEGKGASAWDGQVGYYSTTADTIRLQPPTDSLQLGALLHQFGTPAFTFSQLAVTQQEGGFLVLTLTHYVCFNGNVCAAVELPNCNRLGRMTPATPAHELFFYPASWSPTRLGISRVWQHFSTHYIPCPVVIN